MSYSINENNELFFIGVESGSPWDNPKGVKISKYNLETKEKTQLMDITDLLDNGFSSLGDSFTFEYNEKCAITQGGFYNSKSFDTENIGYYLLAYEDSSCKKILNTDNDMHIVKCFLNSEISENLLFISHEDDCYKLYEILRDGEIKQIAGDIYFNDNYEVTWLGTKLIAFTGDKQNHIEFYDFWDYEENKKVTFKEYDDDDPEKVFLIISDADVRVGPGKVYEKIGLLKQGYTSANLIATGSNGWSRITYNDADVDSNNIVAYIETENIVRVSKFLSSGNCGINAKWSFNEATQTLSISGQGDMFELTGYVGSDYCVPWLQCAPNIKMVKIENGITSIGSYSFNYCDSVTSVDIPESVTKIGDNAFSSCVNLTDIYYAGTQEQWHNCYTGSEEDLDGVTIHYNSE